MDTSSKNTNGATKNDKLSFHKFLDDINKEYERIRKERNLDNNALETKENEESCEENEEETDLKTDFTDDSGISNSNRSLNTVNTVNNTEKNEEASNVVNSQVINKAKVNLNTRFSEESIKFGKILKKNEENKRIQNLSQKTQNINLIDKSNLNERQSMLTVSSDKQTNKTSSHQTSPLVEKNVQNTNDESKPKVENIDKPLFKTELSINNNQNQFVTPLRSLPPPKVPHSLPAAACSSQTLPCSSQKQARQTPGMQHQTPKIMCTIDMRSHMNTPIFQMPAKKSSVRKHLLSSSSSSTSILGCVLEDEDSVENEKIEEKALPLSEQKVKNVFKCIKVKDVEYIVLNELGKGGSSVVYHCYDPTNKEECAVKVVDLKQDKLGFINEVKALKRLQDCDRVIKLIGYEILNNEKQLYMVLEKGGRDFAQILREHTRNSAHLPAFMIQFYWMQMLHAVKQMHSKGVIHSDLKPANFIEIRERLKLIDFGISSCVQLDMTSVMKTIALGTFGYISPEALCADRDGNQSPSAQPTYKVGFKSDVWSLGCILYQLVYKVTPFAHIKHSSARLSAIMDPNHVINYPRADWMPSNVINCIRACLRFNAKQRPTVDYLIQNEFGLSQ